MDRREFMVYAGLGAIYTTIALGSQRKIKIGLIGCGSVSNMYLPHLSKSDWVELVSLCDIKPERAQSQANRFKVSSWFPNIEKMLNGPSFDLLINLTNMQEHGRLNKIALLAGKHVWSEKPMANTYAEGKILLDLAKSQNLHIWGAPAVVNSPQFRFMSEQIQKGTLGKIAAAHAHYGHEGPGWSAFFYEKGGGSLPDLGVYNLASLTGLLGPAKSVVAMTSIITPTRKVDDKGSIKVEAEDNAMVLMEHEAGVISHVQCGFNYFDPHGHTGTGQDRPTISIIGNRGSMHLVGYDWAPKGVDISTMDHPNRTRYMEDPLDYVWEQGASVVSKYLSDNSPTPIRPEHALHVLEIIEAARNSQLYGKRIKLKSTFQYPVI
jgi:predicted dehydrogenase